MKWHDPLYIGDEAAERKQKIISSIKAHKLQFGAYVVILSVNGSDLLDLIPAYMLSQDGYKGHDVEILGIAASKEEAKEVGRRIIIDVYEKTGGFDVRGYFS